MAPELGLLDFGVRVKLRDDFSVLGVFGLLVRGVIEVVFLKVESGDETTASTLLNS